MTERDKRVEKICRLSMNPAHKCNIIYTMHGMKRASSFNTPSYHFQSEYFPEELSKKRAVQATKDALEEAGLLYSLEENLNLSGKEPRINPLFIVSQEQEHIDAILSIKGIDDEARGLAYGYPETAVRGPVYLGRLGDFARYFKPSEPPTWVAVCPFYPSKADTPSGFLPNEEEIGRTYEDLLKRVAPRLRNQRIKRFMSQEFWGDEWLMDLYGVEPPASIKKHLYIQS